MDCLHHVLAQTSERCVTRMFLIVAECSRLSWHSRSATMRAWNSSVRAVRFDYQDHRSETSQPIYPLFRTRETNPTCRAFEPSFLDIFHRHPPCSLLPRSTWLVKSNYAITVTRNQNSREFRSFCNRRAWLTNMCTSL